MKIDTYKAFKEKMNSYMDKIIEKYKEKDEKGMEKLYNKIEKLEKENSHWAAKYDEDTISNANDKFLEIFSH